MAAEGTRYLLFVSKPSGYELAEGAGELPAPGAEVQFDEGTGARFFVTKVGPSPFPGDERPCAYLHAV